MAEGCPWTGYEPFVVEGVSAFEEAAGPFFYSPSERRARFVVEERHCNQLGMCHGGALLTFADFSLFVIGAEHTRTPAHPERPPYLTASLQTHFLSIVTLGSVVEASGEVLSTGRKGDMLVIRGELRLVDGAEKDTTGSGDGSVVLSFDATIKRVGGPPKPKL